MKLYKATIEILIAVPDGQQGELWVADAVSEIMRDASGNWTEVLQDWQWAATGNDQGQLTYEAVPTDGMEFDEYRTLTEQS